MRRTAHTVARLARRVAREKRKRVLSKELVRKESSWLRRPWKTPVSWVAMRIATMKTTIVAISPFIPRRPNAIKRLVSMYLVRTGTFGWRYGSGEERSKAEAKLKKQS